MYAISVFSLREETNIIDYTLMSIHVEIQVSLYLSKLDVDFAQQRPSFPMREYSRSAHTILFFRSVG